MCGQADRACPHRFKKALQACAGLLLACWSLQTAAAREDWQVWFDQAADKQLSEKSSVRAGQSFHYSCDAGQLATYYVEAGYTRYPLSWLNWGLAYRQQYDRRDGHWLEENRPYADVTVRWKTRPVTLSDRNRLEFRHWDEQTDTYRYRNKVTLQYNAWDAGFGLKPYVAAEAFVDESARLEERDQTRSTVGIRTDPEGRLLRAVRSRLGRGLTMDYYVTRQRKKESDRWIDEFIAGIQLAIHF